MLTWTRPGQGSRRARGPSVETPDIAGLAEQRRQRRRDAVPWRGQDGQGEAAEQRGKALPAARELGEDRGDRTLRAELGLLGVLRRVVDVHPAVLQHAQRAVPGEAIGQFPGLVLGDAARE